MSKTKYLFFIIFIILLSTSVFAGVCWFKLPADFEAQHPDGTIIRGNAEISNPNITWTNSPQEPFCIDGVCWDRVVFSNSEIHINGFGGYNARCDDGAHRDNQNFAVLRIQNDKLLTSPDASGFDYDKNFTNNNDLPAKIMGSRYYCLADPEEYITDHPARYVPMDDGTNRTWYDWMEARWPDPTNRWFTRWGNTPPGSNRREFPEYSTEQIIGSAEGDNIQFIPANEFGPEAERIRAHVGGYSFNFGLMTRPVAGTFGENPRPHPFPDNNFFFAAGPSLFILPLGDDTAGFYEKDGNYVRDVYFTVKAQTAVNLDLTNFELKCSSEDVICTIGSELDAGRRMNPNRDYLIVDGQIIIPKHLIPKKIIYSLEINYNIESLAPSGDEQHIDLSVESAKSVLDVGYLDKQDFQIKIVEDVESDSCVGYNGIIGNTGADVAPRINVSTAGPDFNYNLDCSPENDDWVYCSQREFLIVLSNKIAEIFELYFMANQEEDESRRNEIYEKINNKKSFEIYTRNLDLDFDKINEILDIEPELFTDSHLEVLGGNNHMENIARAINLFENTNFYRASGTIVNNKFDAGIQKVSIDMGDYGTDICPTDQTFCEILSGEAGFDYPANSLFGTDNELIAPEQLNLRINITPTNRGRPGLNWFFYETGVEELPGNSINFARGLSYTQSTIRGEVMRFNQDLFDLNILDISIYPNYAIPIFTEVINDGENKTNKFTIRSPQVDQLKQLMDLDTPLFSYWTGFASNLDDFGCEELAMGDEYPALVYRLEDSLRLKDEGANTYEFVIYPTQDLKEGKEYLQTIIYSPILGASAGSEVDLTITSENTNLFDSTGVCNQENCELKIEKEKSDYIINWNNSLQEVLDGIKNETICVAVNQQATDPLVTWTLFWNEDKIISDLTNAKREFIEHGDNDATICESIGRTPEPN